MIKVPNAHQWQRYRIGHFLKRFVRDGLNSSPKRAVTFVGPLNTYLAREVTVGDGTVIEPNVWIMGKTKIGENCKIGFGSVIIDAEIGNNVVISGARIENCWIGAGAEIGYTAQLKRTRFGAFSKMVHHGYLGDALVGERVNIGAGVITANYDGAKKTQTIIEDDVFIGTNVCLIAPILIPRGMMIAAGSVVTAKDPLEPWRLLIARAHAHLSASKRVVKGENGWHLVPEDAKSA